MKILTVSRRLLVMIKPVLHTTLTPLWNRNWAVVFHMFLILCSWQLSHISQIRSSQLDLSLECENTSSESRVSMLSCQQRVMAAMSVMSSSVDSHEGRVIRASDWSVFTLRSSDWLLLMTTAFQQQCCGCAGMYHNVDTDPTGERNYQGSRQRKIHRFISMYRLMTALPSTALSVNAKQTFEYFWGL